MRKRRWLPPERGTSTMLSRSGRRLSATHRGIPLAGGTGEPMTAYGKLTSSLLNLAFGCTRLGPAGKRPAMPPAAPGVGRWPGFRHPAWGGEGADGRTDRNPSSFPTPRPSTPHASVGAGRLDPDIGGAAEAGVPVQADQPYAGKATFHELGGVAGRSVVHEDRLDGSGSWSRQAREAPDHQMPTVVCRYHHRDPWWAAAGSVPGGGRAPRR